MLANTLTIFQVKNCVDKKGGTIISTQKSAAIILKTFINCVIPQILFA